MGKVGAVAEKGFEDIPECNNCYQVTIGQILLRTADVAFSKEEAVAGHVIALQWRVLASSLTFLVIDGTCRLVPDIVASAANHHRPVQLFVIKEIAFGHEAYFFNDFSFDHHGSTMSIGSGVRCVVLTMIFLTTADSRIPKCNF